MKIMAKDLFELWDIIEKTPPRLRQKTLDELCGDDETLKADVLGCVEMSQNPDVSLDVLSLGFSSFVDSYFEPNKLINSTVGNYTLTKYLNNGGMAHVFLAERTDGLLVNQTAVIKVVKPHLIDIYDYNLIDREANIMAQLKNKYIARVTDVGVIAYDALMLPCYIMDYMNRGDIVSFYDFPLCHIDTKINAIIKVCEALACSHDSEVPYLHADIKPHNILMNNQGDPLLCDFGIAQRAKTVTEENHKKYVEVYSCDYSSPEVKNEVPLTFSSDVYSLALVLYEMLTGLKPPFDVKNNLPSKNIKLAVKDVKYKRWLKELDAILIRATQAKSTDRYQSVFDFSKDLQDFINVKKVAAYNNTAIYRFYKYLFLKPVHAFLATAGAISAFTFSVLFLSSVTWVHQQNNNNAFLIGLADNYADSYRYGQWGSLSKAVTILNNSKADNSLTFKHAMAIGEMAVLVDNRDAAVDAYNVAVNVSEQYNLPLVSALYAKSLVAYKSYDKAKKIIEPLFVKLAQSDFATIEQALAYLELFETDIKYISSDYDDNRDDLQLLKTIKERYWNELPNKYKSLLSYHQATELFYFYDGSNISPGDGVSADDHQHYLQAILLDAKNSINNALQFKDSNMFANNQQFIKAKNLKSRIVYELGEYENAIALADDTINMIDYLLVKDGSLAMKTHRNKYVINRLLNLPLASESIKHAVSYNQYHRNDTWMLNTYLLGLSYLYQGDLINAEKQVHNALSYFDDYKENNETKGFTGLDSSAVFLSNYLQFTNFDRANPLFGKVVEALNDLLIETNEIDPDYINDYELKISALYLDFYKNKDQDVLNSISEILEDRKQKTGYQADDLARIMLDMALITAQINSRDEFTLELANKAEALFVWSELEKTHSPDKMSTYLQLASIYLEHGKHDKHSNAMREASVVYSTHYDTLKSSFYTPMFNQKPQITLAK